jgi:hypothetical protein
MWNFSDLRSHLLPLAENVLGDVDKITFAREFNIQEWLAPAHVKLCQRPEPLTTEEATKLGVHSLLMIYRMREQFRPPRQASSSGSATLHYCSSCIGISYAGGGAYCADCGIYNARFYYNATGSQTPNSATNTTALEANVKKWVEDGCVLK